MEESSYSKGVLQSELVVKEGMYEKQRIATTIELNKDDYDKIKVLAGFKVNAKVSARVVLESMCRQCVGAAGSNFYIMKH